METRVAIQGCLIKYEFAWPNGKVMAKDAFKDSDGKKIPITDGFDFLNTDSIIGYAELENREDGVYYTFYPNDTEVSRKAFAEIANDMSKWHIGLYANHIRQEGNRVLKGNICSGGLGKRYDDSSFIEKIIGIDISQN